MTADTLPKRQDSLPTEPTRQPSLPPYSPTFSHSSTFVDTKNLWKQTYIFRCVPSRIGVAIFAPLTFICSIIMAIAASLIANRLHGHLTPLQRLAVIFQIFSYLFAAIASLIGIYSITRKTRKSCQLFCGFLLGHLPFGIASGALCVHIVFKATNQALRASIAATQEEALEVRGGHPVAKPLACSVLEGTSLYWICKKTGLIKALIIILYLILWFLEVVALYAGTRYSTQLHEEKMIKIVEDEASSEQVRDEYPY